MQRAASGIARRRCLSRLLVAGPTIVVIALARLVAAGRTLARILLIGVLRRIGLVAHEYCSRVSIAPFGGRDAAALQYDIARRIHAEA